MSFIDIYNIENWTAGPQTSWFTKLLPILTTILGFALGLSSTVYYRWIAYRNTVNIFKNEMESLLVGVEAQLKCVKDFLNVFIKPAAEEGLIHLDLVLLHKFNTLNTLDKAAIVRFLKKKYKEDAPLRASSLFQMFGVLETDTNRVDKLYVDYHTSSEQISDEFFQEYNKLKLLTIIEKDKLAGKPDVFISKLWEDIFTDKDVFKNDESLMKFMFSIPKTLREEVYKDFKHPLYEPVLYFSMNSGKVLSALQVKKKQFVGLLQGYIENCEEAINEISEL